MSHSPKLTPFLPLILFLLLGLILRFCLPAVLPFALGLAMALMAEPAGVFLHQRLSLPRGLANFLAVTLGILLLSGICALVLALAGKALARLGTVLPSLAASAAQGTQALELWLLDLAAQLPGEAAPLAGSWVERLFRSGNLLWEQTAGALPHLAAATVSSLTGGVMTLITALAAAYLILPRLAPLRRWLRHRLPASWQAEVPPLLGSLGRAAGCWLRAQGILMGITFFILCLGLSILRIPYAPVWAGGIALLDALPLLGTGLFLLPWALVSLIRGQVAQALGLAAVYGVAAGSRWLLEPRLVGRQLGLDPLVTLICMYAGYRLWGFAGMILGPVMAMTFVLSREKRSPDSPG